MTAQIAKFCGTCILLICGTLSAQPERYWQDKWCNAVGGQTEYRLGDRTRVDCLTETHAIEFDFAKKWAESGFQALHYAQATGRTAGIVLITERPLDYGKYLRLMNVIRIYKLPIDVWTVGLYEMKPEGCGK